MNDSSTGGRRTPAGTWLRAAVALAIVGTAVAVYALRPAAGGGPAATAPTATAAATPSAAALPRLVDLGADKCVPCKMMAPILDQLRIDYEGRLRVDFIDVWKAPEAGEPFGIKLIPTQVFQAPDGRELFRHEGFISREDILAKWRELGYAL
jgi:thioredoxin 1